METKTPYSSMAAKPPPKANGAKSNGQQPKAKNPSGAKPNPDRFLGHNQTDLKGILIPEDVSAKHYNELKDRLETLGGSKYIPQIGSSIEYLIRFERKDFASTNKPTAMEYSTTVTNPVTQTMQMVEVPRLKEILMNMYKEELKKKADEWIQYQRDMEKVYRLALGQIDNWMKAKLKGLKSWKTISTSKCIVELLKTVWDLCFQSSQTKVHPVMNVLRAIQNLNVVELLGGTLVCKATVSYELESNPLYLAYNYSTYLTLTGTTRTVIDHTVEQRALVALIIEGSDTDSSNLRQMLADNYALQQNNHPTTSVEALDMVVAFKDSKKPTRSWGNNQTGPTGPNDSSKQWDRKKKEESTNQGSSLFAQQGSETTNLPTDQHSQQLFMTAVESGETFTPSEQTTYMFLNIGMLSHKDTELDGSSLSSSTISSASTYDSSATGSCDDVPALVPRTGQHPNNIKEEQADSHTDYHFSHDVEYLFIQSKSEGGVNPYWILLGSESSLNLIVNSDLVTNI
eukprot:jgi/Psemu1/40719/gm1.40719_g